MENNSDRYDVPRYRRNSLGSQRSGSISSIGSDPSMEEVGGSYRNANSLSSGSGSGSPEPQGGSVILQHECWSYCVMVVMVATGWSLEVIWHGKQMPTSCCSTFQRLITDCDTDDPTYNKVGIPHNLQEKFVIIPDFGIRVC